VTRVIINESSFSRSLERIASQIVERNLDVDRLAVVGIRARGDDLAKRLVELIEAKTGKRPKFGYVDITLYRDDFMELTDFPLAKSSEISFDPKGMNVVLVDDVLYTGRTVRAAIDVLLDFGRPKSIQLAVLVDRGGRELPICPDYVGKEIAVRDDEYVEVHTKETDGVDEVVLVKRSQ